MTTNLVLQLIVTLVYQLITSELLATSELARLPDVELMGRPNLRIMWWKSVLRTIIVTAAVMTAGTVVEGRATSLEIPCQDFSNNINIGCLCSLNEVNATRINCDHVVFPGDFPVLPYRLALYSYSRAHVLIYIIGNVCPLSYANQPASSALHIVYGC